MARSILGTVGLALTLAFAIPVAFLGVDYLLSGRTNQGLLFLGIAVLMVAIEEYVTTPTDIPGMVAGRVLGGAVKEPDESKGPDPTAAGAEVDDTLQGTDAEGADTPDDDEVLIPDAEGNRSE